MSVLHKLGYDWLTINGKKKYYVKTSVHLHLNLMPIFEEKKASWKKLFLNNLSGPPTVLEMHIHLCLSIIIFSKHIFIKCITK